MADMNPYMPNMNPSTAKAGIIAFRCDSLKPGHSISIAYANNPRAAPIAVPKTVHKIKWRRRDIIFVLASTVPIIIVECWI